MIPEERSVHLYRHGNSVQDIRRITKHSFDKVNNTIQHYLRFGVPPETPKIGRPTNLTTVRKARHMLKFNHKPPKHWQFLTGNQKFQRVQFANSLLCSDFNFDRIIFTNDSRFCLGPDNAFR